MITLLLYGWAAAAVAMAALWLRQVRTRNATSVDAAWSAGIALLSIGFALASDGDPARRALVGALGALWGGRLAYYLIRHRVIGHAGTEDGRYKAMREHWGDKAQAGFFVVYQVQALVAVLFSVPILAAMRGGALAPGWTIAGVAVWLLAVGGETLADAQLARFRADPANRGKTCREGLWRYSRHPNYFFEWVHWFAYVLIGVGFWPTWLGPVLMLLFLFRISGIPWTEKQALKSRGDDYRRYQRETSVFFPWFPKTENAT